MKATIDTGDFRTKITEILSKRIKVLKKNAPQIVETGAEEVRTAVLKHAEKCRLTGALMRSIQVYDLESNDNEEVKAVGPGKSVPYGKRIEYGWSKRKPDGYLRVGYEESKERAVKKMEDLVVKCLVGK